MITSSARPTAWPLEGSCFNGAMRHLLFPGKVLFWLLLLSVCKAPLLITPQRLHFLALSRVWWGLDRGSMGRGRARQRPPSINVLVYCYWPLFRKFQTPPRPTVFGTLIGLRRFFFLGGEGFLSMFTRYSCHRKWLRVSFFFFFLFFFFFFCRVSDAGWGFDRITGAGRRHLYRAFSLHMQ